MFCPNCGRENPIERKFCVSCGTNLEVVSQALSGTTDDFLTRTDNALDQFIAKYAEHVFKDAPATASERTIGKSWKILWQAVLTSIVDMLLFTLMWNILPLRFFILLISTPYKKLTQRGSRREAITAEIIDQKTLNPLEPMPDRSLPSSVSSITEHTTEKFSDRQQAQLREASKRGSAE
jgi:hypothetical protein